MSSLSQLAPFTASKTKLTRVDGLIVGYARSAAQGSEATALQRESLEAYANRVFGRPLDAFYEDCHRSGANMDRPGIQKLKHDAQNAQISVIIADDIARIARNLRLVAEFAAFCDQSGIKLHTCMGGAFRDERLFRAFISAETRRLRGATIVAGKVRAKALKASAA